MKRMLIGLAVVPMCLLAVFAQAQDAPKFGPPAEVIAAWENGEGHLLPGPPEWVLEIRADGQSPLANDSEKPFWVARRHAMAERLGLSGPPADVIKAWQNGDGFDLPGPPEFVTELRSLMRSNPTGK